MRPSKENKRQDMLSYDTFLGLSYLHALFETLHALYKILAKRFKFVTKFKQAMPCHVTFRRVHLSADL